MPILGWMDVMTDRGAKTPKSSKPMKAAGAPETSPGSEAGAITSAEKPDDSRKKFDDLLLKAAGVDHLNAARLVINQVVNTLYRPEGLSEKEGDDANFAAIAQMLAYAPKDALEGMLVAQMIAAHNAAMECVRRAQLPNQTFEGSEQNMKHAAKLMGVFTRQVEALDKHRNRGQQKITVEHVTVNAGGQAIVGNIGAAQTPPQPADPLALSYDPGELVPDLGRQDLVPVEALASRRRRSGGG